MHRSEQLAVELIIEAIQKLYGYDFSHYSRASLKRRLVYHQNKLGLASLADMLPVLLQDSSASAPSFL